MTTTFRNNTIPNPWPQFSIFRFDRTMTTKVQDRLKRTYLPFYLISGIVRNGDSKVFLFCSKEKGRVFFVSPFDCPMCPLGLSRERVSGLRKLFLILAKDGVSWGFLVVRITAKCFRFYLRTYLGTLASNFPFFLFLNR